MSDTVLANTKVVTSNGGKGTKRGKRGAAGIGGTRTRRSRQEAIEILRDALVIVSESLGDGHVVVYRVSGGVVISVKTDDLQVCAVHGSLNVGNCPECAENG